MIDPKTRDNVFFKMSERKMFVSNKDLVVYDMLSFTSKSNTSSICGGSYISILKYSGADFNL